MSSGGGQAHSGDDKDREQGSGCGEWGKKTSWVARLEKGESSGSELG